MALAAVLLARDEVVDVDEALPRQAVVDAEAGDADGVLVAVRERGDQPVSLGTLDVVDAPDEVVLRRQLRPQLAHRREGAAGLAGSELSDAQASFQADFTEPPSTLPSVRSLSRWACTWRSAISISSSGVSL